MAVSVSIKSSGITPGTSNSFYVVWALNAKASDKKQLDHYKVKWKYRYSGAKNAPWFDGGESDIGAGITTATYTVPDRAYQINVWINAYSKEKSGKKKKKYWTSKSTSKTYNVKATDAPGEVGQITPTVNSTNLRLSVTVSNAELLTGTDRVQFKVVKKKDGTINKQTDHYNGLCKIYNNTSITGNISLAPEYYYLFQARLYNSTSKKYGPWSDYSERVYGVPGKPTITELATVSPTSTRIKFDLSGQASQYTIQYQDVNKNFNVVPSPSSIDIDEPSTSTAAKSKTFYISELEQGAIYYFRVRATNNTGVSQWSTVEEIMVGSPPSAPTTWSDITAAELGETVYLYWTHNSQDGSTMRKAQINIRVNGELITQTPIEVDNIYLNTRDEDKVQQYELALTETNPLYSFSDADVITWEVRTKGIYSDSETGGYGDWSVTRTITVYQKPMVTISIPSGWLWNPFNFEDDQTTGELEDRTDDESLVVVHMAYPLAFQIESSPVTQEPVSYHLIITADEDYIGVDQYGNEVTIIEGTEIYSGYFDISDYSFTTELSPNEVILEDGVSYTATVYLYMNSGLSAEDSISFEADLESDVVYPEITDVVIDETDWSASIYPICYSNDDEDDDTLAANITLEIYRIDSTGNYIFVGDTENDGSSGIPDPHPSLDYARYRVLARNKYSGRISYQDYFSWEVGCSSIVIQWDEVWNAFEFIDIDDGEGVSSIEETANDVRGAILILPYNVDVNESYSPDAALVEYIGRNYPVSYYGTQRGQSATWNTEIPADDEVTLMGLRELADWMGDVYVREPTGTGYWANVTVSMSLKHKDVLIPVSLSIKRVEGGA